MKPKKNPKLKTAALALALAMAIGGWQAMTPTLAWATDSNVVAPNPPEYSTEIEQINGRLDELEEAVDAMVSEIGSGVSELNVSFPDYKPAYDAYVERVRQGNEQFKKALVEIREEVKQELSELLSIRELYKKRGGEALKKLLAEKEDQVFNKDNKFLTEINDKYQGALASLLTLDGKLLYPAKMKFHVTPEGWAEIGGTAAGYAYAAVAIAGIATGSPLQWLAILWLEPAVPIGGTADIIQALAGDGRSFILDAGWGPGTALFQTKVISTGGSVRFEELEHRAGRIDELERAATKVFSECKTGGCVYLMAEEYKYWMKQVIKTINRKIKLVDGLKLSRLPAPSYAAAKRGLNLMADMVAHGRETAVFTPKP